MSRRARILACGILALQLAGAAPAGAGSPVHHRQVADAQRVRAYWTPARMAAARPVEELAGPVAYRASALRGGFLSAPAPAPAAPPYPANGKVFFRLGGAGYFCSAAIVDAPSARLVWTAAHCVRDPGRNGKWAGRWVFVPGYDQGARPYGSWPAVDLWIDSSWIRNNDNGDFAAAVIGRRNGMNVQAAVGASYTLGTKPVRNQEWEAVGYPADAVFDDLMWHCVSNFHHTDRSGPRRPGPLPFGIGCDMSGGSSGGPWLAENGRLGAITSYGYPARPNLLFGTYLGDWARKLYRSVRNR